MMPEFMDLLQDIRDEFDTPMIITSGYRDISHSAEIKKSNPGAHTKGCAVDVLVRGVEAIRLIGIAYDNGIKRIGVNQKGGGRFVHLDIADRYFDFPQTIWSY